MRVFGFIMENWKEVLKMKTDAQEIGKRIKAIRKDKELTQTGFGEMIGVKGNTVTGYENGTRRPSDAVINYICLVFRVDQTWLRTGEGGNDVVYLPDSDQLDTLSKFRLEFNCNDLEMKFLTAYLGLKENERDAFCELLKKMFPGAISAIAGENPLARPWQEASSLPEITGKENDAGTLDDSELQGVASAEALYESSSGFVPNTDLSASNTTEGTASPDDKPKEETTEENGGGESGSDVG